MINFPSTALTRRVALFAAIVALCGPVAIAKAADGPHLTTVGPAQQPPGSEALCRKAGLACGIGGPRTHLPAASERDLVSNVNEAVNRRIRPVVDPSGIGASWTPPVGNVGDCKHYAVTKKLDLVAAGVDPRRLLLAVVARPDAELHAVLVYRADAGDLVLDSLTNRILGWRESGLTFIKMQNPRAPERWSLVLEGPRARRS